MTLRSLTILFVLGCGLARAEGAKEAQALFEALEQKLSAKETLRVEFTSLMGPPGEQLEFKGELALAPGNKVKLGLSGTGPDGNPLALRMTSNGTTTRTEEEQGGQTRQNDVPTVEKLSELLSRAVARFSIVGPIFLASPEGGNEPAFEVSNFSLGAKEQDGERSLQVIEYDLDAAGQTFHVAVWIDTVSGLPTKRVLDRGEQKAAVSETFDAIEVGPELPEDTFKLTREEAPQTPAHPPMGGDGK
ncbi:MAG: hypothetical protein R3F62_21885 [Planctomycetota bacterium]